jgi:photosystem II stability/assembly factor-like uncharacterized protein
MEMKIIFQMLLFALITNIYAQLPCAFIKNASVENDLPAFSVAIGEEGTVFVGCDDGLRAYSYDGESFELKAQISNGGTARDIAIGSDGTIFVANAWDGLRAYSFNGENLVNTAHVQDDGEAWGVAIGPGGTVFVADTWDGLRAYRYNGSSFVGSGHYNNNYESRDVVVGPDSTVFLANAWGGLHAFSFNGTSFTHTASVATGGDDGEALKIEIGSSGTIFLGNSRDGLRAYTYNGSSFTNTAHIDTGGEAWDIAINSEGTVFLANNFDGLRSFIYDGNSFLNTAHVNVGNNACDLAIDSGGTVFLVSEWEGVFSYTYTGYGGIPFFFVIPNYCFRNNTYDASIRGVNTQFSEGSGISKIWMSKNELDIQATNFQVTSNTSIDAEFDIPSDAPVGLWDISIESSIDTVISQNKYINVALEDNYALQFDGNNGFVRIPSHNSLNMANSSVSLTAWIKSSGSSNGEQVIIEHANYWESTGSYQLTSWESNRIRFSFTNINDDLDYDINFNDGKWHHIVGMLDTDDNKASLYYDGVLVVEKTVYREIGTSIAPTFIGCRGGIDQFFNGEIDEVQIWNKALTLEEIRATMYCHLTGSEDGLNGYWPFNEGTANTVNDLTKNDNNGTVQGATWVGSGAPIGTILIFCYPNYAHQNNNFFPLIQGTNTHFSEGIKNIWLSREGRTIDATRYNSVNNTQTNAKFYIPSEATPGHWGINVETTADSIISMPFGIDVLPPPSVSSQISSTSSWLRSVYALDAETCWSVGNDGSIQKTTNSGITWESQNSGTSDILYSTFFVDGETGWAVGQYGTILSTINGGENWHTQNSGTSDNLQAVYFIAPTTGWAVGRSGTVLKTTNGGTNWVPQNSEITSWLYSICFVDANRGWIVGSNGTIVNTVDGGEIWEQQISSTTNYLSSVCFYDSDTGWAAGSNGTILKTTDGGNNWTSKSSGTTEWLKSIFFIDNQVGWAVGTGGVLVMTLDGGESWSTRKTWTNKTLSSVYYAADHAGWIVGETGTVLSMVMSNLATAIEEKNIMTSYPESFELFQNYPNPFNPTTTINYQLPVSNYIDLSIFNLLGQKVVTLVSKRQRAGFYRVEWNGTDQFGQKVSSGIYVYKLETDTEVQVRKMILIK